MSRRDQLRLRVCGMADEWEMKNASHELFISKGVSSRSGMRLLLIEDSARLRATLERGLRKAGYAVDAAKDGREGLWLATENEYDVIVLDLMLPEIDGLTVLRTLREKGRTTHVLVLSAKDMVEDRVQGLRLGADDYLVKPFSFD